MKKIVILIYTILYRLLHICTSGNNMSKSRIWLLNAKLDKECHIDIDRSQIKRTTFIMNGMNNIVHVCGTMMDRCEIRINGRGNVVTIDSKCNIRESVIVVNGMNCHITIGEATTIGSMYMVCMGQNNYISIGCDCMIADDVDIWATDSHPIFNANEDVCNLSRPIEIGNHVWIGKCAKVLKGAKIHENAIIGMNAMITKDIPAKSLVVGKDRIIKTNVNWDRTFIKV